MSEARQLATVEQLRACIGRVVSVAVGHPEDDDYDDATGPLLSVEDDGDFKVEAQEAGGAPAGFNLHPPPDVSVYLLAEDGE